MKGEQSLDAEAPMAMNEKDWIPHRQCITTAASELHQMWTIICQPNTHTFVGWQVPRFIHRREGSHRLHIIDGGLCNTAVFADRVRGHQHGSTTVEQTQTITITSSKSDKTNIKAHECKSMQMTV
jgi:hypothetical protein